MRSTSPILIVLSLFIASPSWAQAPSDCGGIILKRVQITHRCRIHNDQCFIEFQSGERTQRFQFHSESDGSEASIGFSVRCEGTSLVAGEDKPLRLRDGCVASINFGGPAGAAGAKCVCRGEMCRADD